MFSLGSFSEFALSHSEFSVDEADEAFARFLADVTAERCWLLELEAFPLTPGSSALSGAFSDAGSLSELGFAGGDGDPAAGPTMFYFSSHGFTSQGADTPAHTWYDGRLTDDIRVERRIIGRDEIGGLARTIAEVLLVNTDGALDQLTRDYAIDGRRATLWLGRPTDPRAAFGLVFAGVVERPANSIGGLRLTLSDGIAKLDLPIQPVAYAGSGGLEGGADLKGKPKPLCYGKAFNVTAPLVDSGTLTYQVHAGSIKDVTAVRDRGIALAKVGGAPGAGEYSVNISQGTFQLGGTPTGTVTADVEGDTSLTGYIDRVGDIVLRILVQQAGFTSVEINSTSFLAFTTDAPAPVGIWIGTEPTTIVAVVDELLASVGAFGGPSRTGAFTVGVVAAPGGIVAASYSKEDIITIDQEPLPTPIDPIAWRVLVGWQKNYTVQSDLAAAVPAAARTFAAQQLRIADKANSGIKSRHLLAREFGPVGGLYAAQADAETEAQRLFDLWAVQRSRYRLPVPAQAIVREIGDTIDLDFPRFGLAGGASVRVLGYRLEARGPTVELTVLR